MKRLIWPIIVIMCVLMLPRGSDYVLKFGSVASSNSNNVSQDGRILSLTELAARAKPAVVAIEIFDREGNKTGFGSGFFVNKEGQLITNYYVIAGADTATATTETGKTYSIRGATATAKDADIVSLRVDQGKDRVPFLEFTEELPQVGDRVLVVGNPKGLVGTLSEGIVSEYREIQPYGSVVQIDAALSEGSSGGPVLNMSGKVVGVAAFSRTGGENLNFAIPSAALYDVLNGRYSRNSVTAYSHSLDAGGFQLGGEQQRTVTAIAYSSDRPSAVIGTRIVHEGTIIDGVTVVKIEKSSVSFEGNDNKWKQGVQERPSRYWR